MIQILFVRIWLTRLDNSYFGVLVVTTAGIFTIVPETQYVYLNCSVTFECATNLTGYTLTFSYGVAVDETFNPIDLPDGGKKVTTTFIVTHSLNGTSVRCHADDDDNSFISTSKVYAYAQGLYIDILIHKDAY